jgi:hypothetical protein
VLFVGMLGMLGYSSHLGGRMVYEEGAGVIPMKPIIEQQRSQGKTSAPAENIEESERSYDND